jgi:hypothetical protein
MSNRFSNLRAKKAYKFLSLEIEIHKLSAATVLEIQTRAKALEAPAEDASESDKSDEAANLSLMCFILRAGVPEMMDMSDEEILELPMDELNILVKEIMKFSGMAGGKSN